MHCRIKEKGEWEVKSKNKQWYSQCEGYMWCQDDNGKMGNDYKQEEIKECLKVQKLHTIIETRAGLDLHDSG